MTDTLKAFEKADQKLFEAQQEIKSLRVQVEQLSRVNNEYGEVLTPIWDYCQKNVKVELGKSITEALIESHKELVNKVEVLEQERDEDLMKLHGLGFECHNFKEKLAKANEQVADLEKEIQNIAASIGAGATIEDICNILEGYDSVKQLRKERE